MELSKQERKEIKEKLYKLENTYFSKDDLKELFPKICEFEYVKNIILELINAERVDYITDENGILKFSIHLGTSKNRNCKGNK